MPKLEKIIKLKDTILQVLKFLAELSSERYKIENISKDKKKARRKLQVKKDG